MEQILAPPALVTVTEGLAFPEGPVALRDGSVLVVEIAGCRLTRVRADGGHEVIASLEGGPNGAALGPDGWVYVCNSGGWEYQREPNGWLRPTRQSARAGWIERVRLATGEVERLYEACGRRALRSPNDLVFDRHGGFYFTDHGKRSARNHALGGLYYAQADGSGIVEVVPGMLTANGVGLADDGRTVYVAETVPRRLWAFTLEAPGRVRPARWPSPNGGRLVAGQTDAYCLDSLPVDSSGHITAEPQLASASHLSAGSSCRAPGNAAYATGTDIDCEPWANPPSIGCDEFRAGAVQGPLSVAIVAAYTNVAVGHPVDLTALIECRATASVWDFGDGVVLSNLLHATHAWTTLGNHTVVLQAYNESYPVGVSATITVQVVSQQVHCVAIRPA